LWQWISAIGLAIIVFWENYSFYFFIQSLDNVKLF
jgi:hypothetical protein